MHLQFDSTGAVLVLFSFSRSRRFRRVRFNCHRACTVFVSPGYIYRYRDRQRIRTCTRTRKPYLCIDNAIECGTELELDIETEMHLQFDSTGAVLVLFSFSRSRRFRRVRFNCHRACTVFVSPGRQTSYQ